MATHTRQEGIAYVFAFCDTYVLVLQDSQYGV